MPIGPPFDIQLLTKRTFSAAISCRLNSRSLRLNFRHLWKDKNGEIDHKCEERRRQSDLYVVVNAPRYFPYFGDIAFPPELATNVNALCDFKRDGVTQKIHRLTSAE